MLSSAKSSGLFISKYCLANLSNEANLVLPIPNEIPESSLPAISYAIPCKPAFSLLACSTVLGALNPTPDSTPVIPNVAAFNQS